MILNEFPDLRWLKRQIDQRFADRQAWGGGILKQPGWPSVVLNTEVRQVRRDNIVGPLSLFTNITGTSIVTVDRYPVTVNPDFFFLTNADQTYTLEIEQKATTTETFNIHFGTHFADQVIASLSSSPQLLLNNPFDQPPTPACFYNRLYRRDEKINQLIASLGSQKPVEDLFLEEQLYELLSHLLQQQNQLNRIKKKIPAIKSATREEIFKRLFIATDYIYSFYDQGLSLEQLAQISCFSKFHFLRLFKIAFQKTPHQFITQIRLQKAKQLLKGATYSVHQVAKQVGFENASSFSRLFYNQLGVYPTQFRG